MQHDLLDQFSEVCLSNDDLLTPLETTLIQNILIRAGGEGGLRPELRSDLASAVAEAIAQRATQGLRNSLAERLTLQWSQSTYGKQLFAQRQPAPGPEPMAPRPPSPTPPSPAPSPNSILAQAPSPGPQPMAPRPPSPTPPSPARSPNAAWAQAPSTDPKTGAPRPPSPPPGPAPSPSGIVPWQSSAAAVATAEENVLQAKCVVLEEFLAPAELEALMRYAQSHEPNYRISEVISPGVPGGSVDFEYRRSMVLFELADPGSALVERARAYLPRVLEKLGRHPFPVSGVEAQITASNDGDFFRWHCDDGQGEIATREITFVYFLHREPKPFRGGELRIYDSRIENGAYVPTADYQVVVPRQNQIVFFPSALAHEITPVECPSKAFVDSRFTVNGWFHR